MLQEFVNNAPVEVPDEIKTIVNDAVTAIEARSEKLKEYLTNPESEVHISDLILTDVLDGLLQRARDFVTKVDKDDDSASDEDMKLLEWSIKMNKEQLEKVHETLDAVRKFGCPSLDSPDKFIAALETLVVALQSRGDDLEMCKSLPVAQWLDVESMTPYYMDVIKAAGPELGMAMVESLGVPDLAELSAEDLDEEEDEKCKTVEVKVCNGQLKVVTEGFTPEEHGRIERFFAREFDYPLEQDEQEADGIFAEADKEHLSRIGSFFASERDEANFKDAVAAIELELAEHMNNAKSVGVPYVVDGIKHLVDIPLDTALTYWESRGTDDSLLNLIGIIDLTRQIHKDMYGEYIPLSDKFKLDPEFTKCEGVYKLIYDMNK